MRRIFALLLLLTACSRSTTSTPAPSTTTVEQQATSVPGELIFTGMCDASGAVPLSDTLFAVADDEDNVLRVYDAHRGGAPLFGVDVSHRLELKTKPKKNPKKNKPPKHPETDIEAATRIGDVAYWMTSHGRNSSGKLKPERFRFFATTIPKEGFELQVVGKPYEALLDELLADPRYAAFGLREAAERAPKDPGGLNMEGLTDRQEGGMFIGLRNPIPDGKAMMVPLLNPEGVIEGQKAQFGDPLLVDLDGLGIRSLSRWRGRYLIVAGHYSEPGHARLYSWDGKGAPVHVDPVEVRRFNPEAFFTPEERDEIMLLSDDGNVVVDGKECKRLKDPGRKRFRGLWVTVPGSSK